MPPFEHFGPDRPWWGVFGWLMPFLLVLILAAVAVWVVVRITRQPAMATVMAAPPVPVPATPIVTTPPTAPADPALERVRMRYASGEIGRDEYLRLSSDLGVPPTNEEENDG